MLMRRFARDKRGQSLVEMALILPLLIIILFGIVEFGRVFHSYITITHAAREGARAGVVGQPNDVISQRVLQIAPQAQISDITPDPGARTSGVPLTVSVDCQVELFTPIIGSIIPNPINLSAQTTMRME